MAIEEFWLNLRTAASFYASTVTADSAHVDAGHLERMLRGAGMWLTPRSVDGFDPSDFSFLAEEKQEALRTTVERFRAVARQVPANKPATRQQAEEGRTAFGDLLSLLQPHRFRDAESFQTQVELERELLGKLPRWVTGIFCETGRDLSDEPAVWIWVEVTDEATDKNRIAKYGQRIEEEITSAYRQIGGRRWPFVRFRNPSEMAGRQGVAS
jgi:hypothetical protein